mmetsp:Transcript_9312/g.13592  ORF Transcript_9312/g.13592 Transcript_9312/m.13592 type:complete len:191 (-) Transcript_9312:299-871(-)|eukprot:CAMPEP_0194222928 /NCGR_PEP_ID=MMETSP0156-20130528/34038_1 /TAXON_ID=33649 /ORGANISM="Thalassionema nitzschioides, Strain L26-B" /LENGTH=190 /DNA_ID=CAMNT_0038953901 /DNA_START=104 /DNA_END=676 /DNA_ORIENTATION=-
MSFPLTGAPKDVPDTAGGTSAQEGTDLVDLRDKIEKNECYARNESSRYPMTNLFIGDSRLGCQSDADEELILHIVFQEFVKLKFLKFTEFNQGAESDLRPTRIHIFVNRNNLGFEDIQDVEPTQTLELTAADLSENADPIELKYVLFQRVKSITLFVEENAGGEVSALGGLKILGRTTATTNMNDFKKQG